MRLARSFSIGPLLCLIPLLLTLLACSESAEGEQGGGASSGSGSSAGQGGASASSGGGGGEDRYADESLWLCRPGMAVDQCLVNDLSATELLPDNTTRQVAHQPAADPKVDCFYVYPTVDLSLTPGNHDDLSNITPMLGPLLAQAAPFTELCRMFAPLYRQGTIAVYSAPDTDSYLEFAYADIEQAFRHYLAASGERNFVIMGHSQGAHMTRRLLQRMIAPDPALRARLVVALLLGGDVSTSDGAPVGGSFADIPLCSAASETGCVVAYRSYAASLPPPAGVQAAVYEGAGQQGVVPACNNPPQIAAGVQRFRAARFATSQGGITSVGASFPAGITTPYVIYPDFYAGACAKDASGLDYLGVRVEPDAGDARSNPVAFDSALLSPSWLGLHVYDYQFAHGDLLELTRLKSEAM